MKCLACGENAAHKSVTPYFADLGGRYVIVENVPCEECEECGEKFYTLSVTGRIDRLLKSAAPAGKVSILDYASASQGAV